MSATRTIAVVTGARAEYGLLAPVLRAVAADKALALRVIATGMHLSPEFGLTARAIEADGFAIDWRVEMLLSSDTPWGTAKSMGLGVIGFADAFAHLSPDIVVLLGDRFELLCAAQAALVARIPVAHIFGGDSTEGAFDEAIRHAITKMSHLHFPVCADSARRVRQLGEDPARIHMVGSPGLDAVLATPLLSREELARDLGFDFRSRNLLVTYHPATLGARPAPEGFAELLAALDGLGPDTGLLFTRPNADPAGRELIGMLDAFVAQRPWAAVRTSLGQVRYYSAIAAMDAVVGNSSSGLLEVPSFKKPTVNVGDRQRGRIQAASVVSCPEERGAIRAAIERALGLDCSGVVNPFGDGHAAERIRDVLRDTPDLQGLLAKRFHDLPQAGEGT